MQNENTLTINTIDGPAIEHVQDEGAKFGLPLENEGKYLIVTEI